MIRMVTTQRKYIMQLQFLIELVKIQTQIKPQE